jgi:hypothetical protein
MNNLSKEKQKELQEWNELEEIKSYLNKVFTSQLRSYQIPGDDLREIYKIVVKSQEKR